MPGAEVVTVLIDAFGLIGAFGAGRVYSLVAEFEFGGGRLSDLWPTGFTGVCNPQTAWQVMVVGALTSAPTLWTTLKPRFGGASLWRISRLNG